MVLSQSISTYYRLYYFKNKGTCLILIWSFAAAYSFHNFIMLNWKHQDDYLKIFEVSGILVYPILGWLADARFGRYRAVKYSMQAIWALSILHCLLKALFDHFCVSSKTHLSWSVQMIIMLVLGGFLSNIIQLGVDQIPDAPSVEVSSFCRWYGWTYFLGQLVSGMTANCKCKTHKAEYALVDPVLYSIMLCLDGFCAQWLMKEPSAFKNPLKVIYQVLKYAYRHKYPHLRSTYFYWDSKVFSRINLAKSTFGGPFTTDEVESVKAFFRMLTLLTVGALFASTIIFSADAANRMVLHLKDDNALDGAHITDCSSDCFWRAFVDYFGIIFVVVVFPLLEFLFFPWVKKFVCIERLSLTSKFILGMLFNTLAVVNYGTLDLVGHQQINFTNGSAAMCILNLNFDNSKIYEKENKLPLNFAWLMLPSAIYYVGNFLMIVSSAEFICAQSPPSMKGFLFGLLYGLSGLSILINFTWSYPVQSKLKNWNTITEFGCGAVYFLLLSSILVVITGIFCFIIKFYKKTQRDFNQSSGSDGITFTDYHA